MAAGQTTAMGDGKGSERPQQPACSVLFGWAGWKSGNLLISRSCVASTLPSWTTSSRQDQVSPVLDVRNKKKGQEDESIKVKDLAAALLDSFTIFAVPRRAERAEHDTVKVVLYTILPTLMPPLGCEQRWWNFSSLLIHSHLPNFEQWQGQGAFGTTMTVSSASLSAPSRLSRYKNKGFCSAMAFAAPAAVFLDENLPIHRGKRADGLNVKPLKPSARKALRDVSNTSKPPIPSIKGTALNDRSVLKDKSALRNQETIKKNPVNKTTIFADHEWAKGGVEGTHFTGNDAQKLDKDKLDERVKKEVEKVNSALSSALDDWTYVIFDHLLFPAKAVAPFYEVNVLELEPEIFPEITSTRLSTSGDLAEMAEDCFGEAEHDNCPFLENKPVEFQLRDDLEWMD